ncbi:MAG TPA: DNA polymerase III subunit delta, partial [Candidatus Gracilibacteria bacterium]|nr:DNA polymerase III subunit delta [Candidatus Gracilibacteria bacterium]
MAVFFWTGPAEYLIKEKKNLWQTEFLTKYGDINFSVIDGTQMPINQVISEILTGPFLGEKRLIFIKNLPPSTQDKVNAEKLAQLEAFLDQVPGENVVVFIQTNPDKRLSFYKKLLNKAKIEEFSELKMDKLQDWVKTQAQKYQAQILPSAIPFLIERVGVDMIHLDLEIQKLANYTDGQKSISENDIRKLCLPLVEGNNFIFNNSLLERN